MQMYERITDDSLMATVPSGTPEFPLETYFDELDKYKGQRIGWHWHPEFEFSLVILGPVVCRVGAEEILLETGDGIFLNSGVIHEFQSDQGGIMENILFSHTMLATEGSAVYNNYVAPLLGTELGFLILRRNEDRAIPVLDRISALYRRAQTAGFMRELRSLCVLLDLWAQFYESFQKEIDQAEPAVHHARQTRMHRMMDFIQREYTGSISLEEIAAAGGVSKSEALRCFKQTVKMTPGQYLTNYRLSRAKAMLSTMPNSVTTIAAQTGFSSTAYFCRVFKQETGISPETFRTKEQRRVDPRNETVIKGPNKQS